jgi:hypothetical protein
MQIGYEVKTTEKFFLQLLKIYFIQLGSASKQNTTASYFNM